MIEADSIFGVESDRLRRLLKVGLDADDSTSENPTQSTASLDELMEKPGAQIGRYKLLRVLGEGGMGIVYLAQQEKPVGRQVALKIIKPGMDSKRVIARFEAEQQALALIEHSYVARVHDAGLTTSGRPYFVMEYVRGIPLTEHCDKHKLTVEERLGLFLHICEAIQYAHQKGVIHRDLKPSNILVTIEESKAIPKVIDFGVARAVSQPLTERTIYTEQGQIIGTPEYMSPEQADLNNQDIDTRSDIYSLGVVLYELLTGIPPFDPQTFQAYGIEHMRKVICEEEPKTPSTRLSKTSVEESTESARRRRTNAKALQRRLHGDLDWITLKAMEKDRTRRYASVSEFSTDIIRHLNNEPVLAGPPSMMYKVKKFVRRNRVLVAGIVLVLAVLISGIVVSTIFAVGQARARAEAQAVSDFLLKSVLGSLDLWDMRGQEITVRSILDAASQGLEGKLTTEPLVEASIRWTLAASYTWLGLYEPAESHAKRALEIRRAHLGDDHLLTLLSLFELGWLYFFQSRYTEAELHLNNALEGMKPMLNEEHPAKLHCKAVLGYVYNMQGRFAEAQLLFEGVLSTTHRILGEESEHSPTILQGLGLAYQMQGRYKDAERLFERGLDISRRIRGELDWETMNLMFVFGSLCREQGRYDQAEQLLVEALDRTRRVRGEEHTHTLWTMEALARLYLEQSRYDKAEQLFSQTLDRMFHVRGKDHEETLSCMNGIAVLYTKQERYNEAESLFNEVLEGRRRRLGEDRHETLETINDLGILHREHKQHEKAEKYLNEALEGRQINLGPDHPHTLQSMHELAILYKEQERYDRAETLLVEALKGRRLKLGDAHPHTLESWNNLIELYEAWGKPKKAEEWRAKLPQTEAVDE